MSLSFPCGGPGSLWGCEAAIWRLRRGSLPPCLTCYSPSLLLSPFHHQWTSSVASEELTEDLMVTPVSYCPAGTPLCPTETPGPLPTSWRLSLLVKSLLCGRFLFAASSGTPSSPMTPLEQPLPLVPRGGSSPALPQPTLEHVAGARYRHARQAQHRPPALQACPSTQRCVRGWKSHCPSQRGFSGPQFPSVAGACTIPAGHTRGPCPRLQLPRALAREPGGRFQGPLGSYLALGK